MKRRQATSRKRLIRPAMVTELCWICVVWLIITACLYVALES